MKRIFSFLFIGLVFLGKAQELNVQVSVILDARLEVTSTEREILKEMENTIYEFMNNTKWTNDKFKVEERINCNLQFQIQEIPSQGTFKGFLQVQSTRPVLNSSYNTTVFNYQDDDIVFSFNRNTMLIYTPNQFRDNLTSILSYYAYFILGMDYDSFSKEGGTKHFTTAQQIVMNAQASGAPGWKANEKGRNNRFWLVDNILHNLYKPLRECNYIYHRKGLDVLYEDIEKGRRGMIEGLSKLTRLSATRPNSVNVLNFIRSKSDEIKNLFESADLKEKNEVVNILKRVDPMNSSKYQEILN